MIVVLVFVEPVDVLLVVLRSPLFAGGMVAAGFSGWQVTDSGKF